MPSFERRAEEKAGRYFSALYGNGAAVGLTEGTPPARLEDLHGAKSLPIVNVRMPPPAKKRPEHNGPALVYGKENHDD